MPSLYTIGHSTRPIEDFIKLLHAQQIEQLIDIRSIPRSRHNPQYEQHHLEKSLHDAGIEYVYLKELGGRRPSTKSMQNAGWRNKSFRNYADYMQTEEFQRGVERLLECIAAKTTVIMCAEAVPWRCHRSLVGDALVVRGVAVYDIIGAGEPKAHSITPFAKVSGTEITYPEYEESSG